MSGLLRGYQSGGMPKNVIARELIPLGGGLGATLQQFAWSEALHSFSFCTSLENTKVTIYHLINQAGWTRCNLWVSGFSQTRCRSWYTGCFETMFKDTSEAGTIVQCVWCPIQSCCITATACFQARAIFLSMMPKVQCPRKA